MRAMPLVFLSRGERALRSQWFADAPQEHRKSTTRRSTLKARRWLYTPKLRDRALWLLVESFRLRTICSHSGTLLRRTWMNECRATPPRRAQVRSWCTSAARIAYNTTLAWNVQPCGNLLCPRTIQTTFRTFHCDEDGELPISHVAYLSVKYFAAV